MHDEDKDMDHRYIETKNYKGFKHKKITFAISSLLKGINTDIVILSHINLLFFAFIIKKLSPKTKIVMYAHGIELWREIPNWKKKFLQESVEIWAVSKYTSSTLTARHQISTEKIKIVNNCLDTYFKLPNNFEKPITLLARYNLNAAQPILFTLTRLSSLETYKGYDRVLSSMPALLKKFPNLHYVLAGKADDVENQRVLSIVEQLNLKSHVTLVGFIKDEELTDYFKLGNIFVMPSTMEGFGIVFIEAAACGAKIIAGNVDGSVDALLNGELGTLINPEDVDAITQAIEENLNRKIDPKQIQDCCMANFSYEQYLKRIKELIIPTSNKAA